MKLIEIKPSNKGHNKKDYIFSISDIELLALRKLISVPSSTLEMRDNKEKLKNAHQTISDCLKLIK